MIPSAKEAKEQSEKNAVIRLQEKKVTQLASIEKMILEAIEEGKTSVHYPMDIYDELVEKLHDAGYSITKVSYRSSNYVNDVIIRWGDEE